MRRNKHIGWMHIKWHFFAIVLGMVYLFFSDNILFGISSFFSAQEQINEWIVFWRGVALEAFVVLFIGEGSYQLWLFIRAFIKNKKSLTGVFMAWVRAITWIYTVGYLGLYMIFSHLDIDDINHSVIVFCTFFGVLYIVLIPSLAIMYEGRKGYEKILRLKDSNAFMRLFTFGYGGSSRWAHVLDYKKRRAVPHPKRDRVGVLIDEPFLGTSVWDDDPTPRPIVVTDDAHLVTIGMTGSGKSTTVLYPNLALYDGSIFIFDPKGELAKKTFRRRDRESGSDTSKMGNTRKFLNSGSSYVLDPFKELNEEFPEASFNPLQDIDLDSEKDSAIIKAISDGCVVPGKDERDEHWTEWSKTIIEALIVHTISRYPNEKHNLPFILDLLTGGVDPNYEIPLEKRMDNFSELLVDMATNDAMGGLPKQVSSQIMNMGANEKGSVLSTTYRNLRWVGEPAMREQLSNSNIFEGYSPYTVYMVLPSDMISSHMRWIRVLTGVFLARRKKENAKNNFHGNPDLFIIDEFGQLGGSIDAITKGFPILRGFNIKLWLFVQSISQLKDAFGEKWTDVISASTVQTFGINDPESAEWISKRLGARVNPIKEKRGKKVDHIVRERIDPLLTPDEVEYMLGKESNMQIVFPTQGRPMRLERNSYKPLPNFNPVPFDLKGHFEDW